MSGLSSQRTTVGSPKRSVRCETQVNDEDSALGLQEAAVCRDGDDPVTIIALGKADCELVVSGGLRRQDHGAEIEGAGPLFRLIAANKEGSKSPVVTPGIEPGTSRFSVVRSTN